MDAGRAPAPGPRRRRRRDPSPAAGHSPRAAARRRSITVHDLAFERLPEPLRSPAYRPLRALTHRAAARRAAAVICVSRDDRAATSARSLGRGAGRGSSSRRTAPARSSPPPRRARPARATSSTSATTSRARTWPALLEAYAPLPRARRRAARAGAGRRASQRRAPASGVRRRARSRTRLGRALRRRRRARAPGAARGVRPDARWRRWRSGTPVIAAPSPGVDRGVRRRGALRRPGDPGGARRALSRARGRRGAARELAERGRGAPPVLLGGVCTRPPRGLLSSARPVRMKIAILGTRGIPAVLQRLRDRGRAARQRG